MPNKIINYFFLQLPELKSILSNSLSFLVLAYKAKVLLPLASKFFAFGLSNHFGLAPYSAKKDQKINPKNSRLALPGEYLNPNFN